ILLAGLLGFWWGGQWRQSPARRVRAGLWVIIGGLVAYLLAAGGWLRPEQWFSESPSAGAARLALAALVCLFGLAGLFIGRLTDRVNLLPKRHPQGGG
ncbi:MAG: hypothetical protein D6768_01120, partial [Chloroflexi bacterium]